MGIGRFRIARAPGFSFSRAICRALSKYYTGRLPTRTSRNIGDSLPDAETGPTIPTDLKQYDLAPKKNQRCEFANAAGGHGSPISLVLPQVWIGKQTRRF